MSVAKLVGATSFCLLAGYVAALAFGTPLVGLAGGFSEKSFGDFALNLSESQDVVARGAYRSLDEESHGFLYPPPYVIWKVLFARLGPAVSGLLWAGFAVLSILLSFSIMFSLLNLSEHPYRWSMALAALLSVGYFVEWDLKALNCNSVYLFLVLAFVFLLDRGSPRLAGSVLAASVALKLYSVFFLPYLFYRKNTRALVAALLGLVFLFAVVPSLYFTPPGAIELCLSWLRAIKSHSAPDAPLYIPAYIVSLQRALLVKGALWIWTGRLLQVVWLALAAGFFFLPRLKWTSPPSVDRLQEASVVMLLPLVLSPMLQPHHGVVALVAALVLVREAAERPRRRVALSLALAGTFALLQFGPTGPMRGLGVNAALFILLGALYSVRSPGDMLRQA